MLMSSLPRHDNNLDKEKIVPLSRIQLDKRLAILDEKDLADLLKIEGLLHWSHMNEDIDQVFVNRTTESIESIDNTFIKSIVIWRLEIRIILAAIRMRHQGLKHAPTKEQLGFDYWNYYISNYWNEVDFGLGKQLPWLAQANEYLVTNQSLQLEKLLYKVVWEHYHRQNFAHYFDFEAVIIYVLRWDIVSRWIKKNNELAIKRFDSLVETGLQSIDL